MTNPVVVSDEHAALLRRIRKERQRPGVQSDDWDRFCDLSDWGLVEDLGLGDARITPAGRRALTKES